MRDPQRIRLLVYPTVFGALWGALEMTAGTALHMMHFPFRGAMMAGLGAVLLSCERVYTPVRGATLATGLAAMAVKCLSLGGFKLGPTVGILIESAVLEAVFTLFGTGTLPVFLGSVAACLEGIPHFFTTNWILYGRGVFDSYLQALSGVQRLFGLPDGSWRALLALWLAGHLLLGAFWGLIAVAAVRRTGRARAT